MRRHARRRGHAHRTSRPQAPQGACGSHRRSYSPPTPQTDRWHATGTHGTVRRRRWATASASGQVARTDQVFSAPTTVAADTLAAARARALTRAGRAQRRDREGRAGDGQGHVVILPATSPAVGRSISEPPRAGGGPEQRQAQVADLGEQAVQGCLVGARPAMVVWPVWSLLTRRPSNQADQLGSTTPWTPSAKRAGSAGAAPSGGPLIRPAGRWRPAAARPTTTTAPSVHPDGPPETDLLVLDAVVVIQQARLAGAGAAVVRVEHARLVAVQQHGWLLGCLPGIAGSGRAVSGLARSARNPRRPWRPAPAPTSGPVPPVGLAIKLGQVCHRHRDPQVVLVHLNPSGLALLWPARYGRAADGHPPKSTTG
jgi:hypothetical protein